MSAGLLGRPETHEETHMRRIVEGRRLVHGDKFDASDLVARFAPYLHTATRLRVVGPFGERTGRVGITTGWQPAFLLMHRSSDHGSSDVLGPEDRIVAVKRPGERHYRPVSA